MTPRKFLIVDDSEVARDIVQYELEGRGHTVIGLDSPLELMSVLRREQPDLVLVDVGMPAITGDQVVEVVSRSERGRWAFVLYSDRPEAELAALAARSGAIGYLQKSDDPEAFVTRVEQLADMAYREPGARKNILVLDDSEIVLSVARRYLEAEGYAVVATSSLAEFEERLAQSRPDLVLLDVQMPQLYGDDVGSVLRHVRGVSVPIVLFSTLPDAELAQRVSEAGIDGYVSKNAGIEALVTRVRELLGP